MPRILGNPVTFEEIELAKKNNLIHGTVENLTEELLGEDGTFKECEAEPNEEVVQACDCCGDEMVISQEAEMVGDASQFQSHSAVSPPMVAVNSEERIVDFKNWRQLVDSGINIEYRCIWCRSCHDCKDADQTEKVSFRHDAENELVRKPVKLDYDKKEILATLPLRGLEEEFLAPNEERARCVLNQQCKKLKGKPDDIKAVQKIFQKLFDRGRDGIIREVVIKYCNSLEQRL